MEQFAPFLEPVLGDTWCIVTHFCRMYDYRSRGQDWGNSRDSIERAIWYLTTRKPEEEK